jgi:hypothetical protein
MFDCVQNEVIVRLKDRSLARKVRTADDGRNSSAISYVELLALLEGRALLRISVVVKWL